MKRALFGLIALLALSLATTSPASAAISSQTLDTKADLSASKTSAVATGTIVCTAGNDVNVQVIILQNSGKVDSVGTGDVDIVCTGAVQTYSVTVSVLVGSAFKHGPATALFGGFDNTDNTSGATLTQGVKL